MNNLITDVLEILKKYKAANSSDFVKNVLDFDQDYKVLYSSMPRLLDGLMPSINTTKFFKKHQDEINYLIWSINKEEYCNGESVFTLPEFDKTDLLCLKAKNQRFLVKIVLEERIKEIAFLQGWGVKGFEL